MKKNFKLENEIKLYKFDNGKKGLENISGEFILYKDDKIIGLMKKRNFEILIHGKKRMGKFWINNALDKNNLYNLTDNFLVYIKHDKEYEVNEKINFRVEEIKYNRKKVDKFDRRIMNHYASNDNDTTNRVLSLKMSGK